jgi:aspartate 1-decarboxylase
MLRTCLKSKLHNVTVTAASVDYMGSITIDQDWMELADLWDGEQVLVASSTSGARLTTYAICGKRGSGCIEMNGAAALLIGQGERVIIMAFGLSDRPVEAKVLLFDEHNRLLPGTGR